MPRRSLRWVKSRFSGGNGECVELAHLPLGGVAVRDSKRPEGVYLDFLSGEWLAFVKGVKAGEFDAYGVVPGGEPGEAGPEVEDEAPTG